MLNAHFFVIGAEWDLRIPKRLGVKEKSASLGPIRTWQALKLERENIQHTFSLKSSECFMLIKQFIEDPRP